MRIIVTSLKEYDVYRHEIIKMLNETKFETFTKDFSSDNASELGFFSAKLIEGDDELIVIDDYGVGAFNAINKSSNIVCANCYDEHSAQMTKSHNNARAITIGAELIALTLAKSLVLHFVNSKYDAGRHQIRVDMLEAIFEGGK